MTLKPGYGVDRLNLRLSTCDLLAEFGKPAKRRRSGAFREYWLYPEHGFDCIVSRRTAQVLSVFLRPNSALAGGRLAELTEEDIRRTYGAPSRVGGGISLPNDDFFGRWFSYDSGIGFYFDREGHVRTVGVFAARRKTKAPAVVRHGHSHTRSVAALRNG